MAWYVRDSLSEDCRRTVAAAYRFVGARLDHHSLGRSFFRRLVGGGLLLGRKRQGEEEQKGGPFSFHAALSTEKFGTP